MNDFNLNISTSKIEKLKEATDKFEEYDLQHPEQFYGDAENIFDSLNTSQEYWDLFSNTGMRDILIDIAGEDGVISEEDFQKIINADGDSSFSGNDFVAYANQKMNNAIEEFNLDKNKETEINNYENFQATTQVIQKNNNGTIASLSEIRDNGNKQQYIYNDFGKKDSSLIVYPDGSRAETTFKYDANGNKIGATTKRYDANNNIQSTATAEYDEKGRETSISRYDADNKLKSVSHYRYEEKDGVTTQIKYDDKTGEVLSTKTYTDNIKTPLSKTNPKAHTVENFNASIIEETNEQGFKTRTQTSSVFSEDGTKKEDRSYNADTGLIKSKKIYNDFGELIAEVKYIYDDNGILKDVEKQEFASVHGDKSKEDVDNNSINEDDSDKENISDSDE